MGCDGGTIPRRDELVRVKKKPEEVMIYNNNFLKKCGLNILFYRKIKMLNANFDGYIVLLRSSGCKSPLLCVVWAVYIQSKTL